MTAAELARHVRKVSNELPSWHPSHPALDEIHNRLMAEAQGDNVVSIAAFSRPDHQPEPPQAA